MVGYIVLAMGLLFFAALGWSYKSGQPLFQLPGALLQLGFQPEWLQYCAALALLSLLGVGRELMHLSKLTSAESALLPDGLRFNLGGRKTQIHWGDITQIWQLITQAGSDTRQAIYRLQTRSGDLHTLNAEVPNVELLGQTAQQKFTELGFNEALAAFRAGKAQLFGDLQLDPIGLLHKKQLLGWQQIAQVRVQAGDLQVMQSEKNQPVVQVSLEEIPNVYLMLSLLCEIIGKERIQFK